MTEVALDGIEDLADKNGHVMVAISGWNEKNVEITIPIYQSFQTYEQFLNWYDMMQNVCEVTWQDQPMKAYLHLDEICGNEVIKQRAVDMGLRSCDWEPVYVVAVASRFLTEDIFKYSVRIVFLNMGFTDRAHLYYFMKPICDEIRIIDQSVYRSLKTQEFRFPGSIEWDDINRVPLKPHPRWSTKEPAVADFIIGNPDPEKIVKFDLPGM